MRHWNLLIVRAIIGVAAIAKKVVLCTILRTKALAGQGGFPSSFCATQHGKFASKIFNYLATDELFPLSSGTATTLLLKTALQPTPFKARRSKSVSVVGSFVYGDSQNKK